MKHIYAFVCAMAMALRAYAATPLSSGKFLTSGGTFYRDMEMGWEDYTNKMPYVDVLVDGNQVTIIGLAYWFEEAGVVGTMDGNTITFPSGQFLGDDGYGEEYLLGSTDMMTPCDIVFEYDPSAQTLTSVTPYIFESGYQHAVSPYCYWENAVFIKEGATPQTIDQTAVSTKAVKHIANGQLIITRDGKSFNVLGAEL